jgi:hypothetical protein
MKFPVVVLVVLAAATCANAQLTVSGFNGLTVSLSSNGIYSISIPNPALQISGNLSAVPSNSRIATATDNIGAYQELAFDYAAAASQHSASIRAYSSRPVVVFADTYNNASPNVTAFPVFAQPAGLLHLSFNGLFAFPTFSGLMPDSPWVYFDAAANTVIISPAANYMVAAMTPGSGTQIQSGISSGISTLPAGFTHRTAMAFGPGINQTFAAWGQALTDLAGKKRPANDADALLKAISYWTDNGATYYYNPGGPSYTDTLQAVKAEFVAKGVSPGTLQLDSWWYPKGPDDAWSSHGGIWTYTASTAIFQPTLASFQEKLGLPLTTHARWIDAASPYQGQYTISGGVATDPRYWEDTAAYLQSSGVTTYEQDWLGTMAQTKFNLTDPAAFLDNMAAAMSKYGIDMQYCMATPKHFLQSTNYSNLTSARTSQDGFGSTRWTEFLYGSRLASALGIWPFSDVIMSTDTNSLILATLSAGPVGIGDALGGIFAQNLLRSVRADGVIVKPDAPVAPVDSVIVSDAQGIDTPMVASTYSDFGGLRAQYIFAYTRATNAPITISPSAWGIMGAAYLFDYLNDAGYLIEANNNRTINLVNGVGYFILAPVGRTGIAFLGDKGQFVTLGKQRIPALTDDGHVDVTVSYAAGEDVRIIFGYSPKAVSVTALSGSVDAVVWDPASELFSARVQASSTGAARVRIGASAARVTPGSGAAVCGVHCRPSL